MTTATMTTANMTTARTQLYLISPPLTDEVAPFAAALTAALDAGPVGCVRLRFAAADEAVIAAAADQLSPICHDRGVALVIEDYFRMVQPCGLDGVHLSQAVRQTPEARDAVGPSGILGVDCGASRHTGMIAAERGADYVSLGPLAAPAALQTSELAEPALFRWWQDVIETPVVAEGGITPEIAATLTGAADFIGADDAVWRHPDGPAAGVAEMLAVLRAAVSG